MTLPNSLYAAKRSLTIENFHQKLNDINKMNSVSNIPSHATVANVPSNVPIRVIAPSNAPASNITMRGNIASVPPNASAANVPSNVRINVIPNSNIRSNNSNMRANAMSPAQGCPLAPPIGMVNYCRPGPFQSASNEKYFRVSDAYGSPTAS